METTTETPPVPVRRSDVRELYLLGQIHRQLRSARQIAVLAAHTRTALSIEARIACVITDTMKVAENLGESDPECRWANPPLADLERTLREARALNSAEAVAQHEAMLDPKQSELAALLGDLGEPVRRRP